ERLRRQQRRRPRSVSGLIREPHRTSQQAKFEKLRKFDKRMNLICYFGFLEMPADGPPVNGSDFAQGNIPRASKNQGVPSFGPVPH
ncbi:hypothetical protein, partial [Agrobacterium pusense]|uniref:hypothetical protein n=1 Tax=Agrobacterium pusense TaxID=648995 RepID=UPI001AED00AF